MGAGVWFRGGWFGLVLAAGACVPVGGARSPAEPVREVALYDGAVVVSGPPGYCIDSSANRRRGSGRFVLLASCASLGSEPGPFVEPAVFTVSVLPHDAAAVAPTAAQLAGSVAPAEVLARHEAEGVSVIHLAHGGEQVLPGGDPRYWRAGLVVNGHLVGLAAYAPAGGTLAGPDGRRSLMRMARDLRNRSGAQ